MPKTNKTTYNEVEHEQDSYRMMERINQQSDDKEAAREDRCQKQMHEQEKNNRLAMSKYALRCFGSVLITTLLFVAMKHDLISAVLAIPATYISTCYLGWCACKVSCFYKKLVNKK